jgi:hypothetical protein
VATGVIAVSPLTAAAGPRHAGSRATTAGAGGTVYGGATAQDFPVVIETTKNGRKVVKAMIGIDLTCTSGDEFSVPDKYTALSVSKKRKFGVSLGPATFRNDDGTTTDIEQSMSGAFNKARTTVSGKWSVKLTERDASGAVTDTCGSGSVSWTAKQ